MEKELVEKLSWRVSASQSEGRVIISNVSEKTLQWFAVTFFVRTLSDNKFRRRLLQIAFAKKQQMFVRSLL